MELKICVTGRVNQSVAIIAERCCRIPRMKGLLALRKPLVCKNMVFLVIHPGAERGEYPGEKQQAQSGKQNNLARIFSWARGGGRDAGRRSHYTRCSSNRIPHRDKPRLKRSKFLRVRNSSGLIDQAVMNRVERQFEPVGNAQLVKNIVEMILYGLL